MRCPPAVRRLIRLGFVLVLFLPACKENKPTPPQTPPLDLNTEIQKGWALYRAHDFRQAAGTFQRLIGAFPDAADPYVGRGWCYIEADSLPEAMETFHAALRRSEDPDAFAGLAVAASALGEDSVAVDATATAAPGYVFFGNPDFGYRELVYLRALGEFHLLRWASCYGSLLILDPELVIDLEAWDFREQLIAALESVRGRA